MEKFSCEGDPESLHLKWVIWKRAFEIYLTAANIHEEKAKRATLLHTGGLQLQQIFYNIPGTNVECLYETAIKKLDDYFMPKYSQIYQRHLFRKIQQKDGENFDIFLSKLRNQAEKCMFSNSEENIIDQILEKCQSNELRKTILLLSDEEINLDKIITIANTLESVTRHLHDFSNSQKINEINKLHTLETKKNKSCSRCGSQKHSTTDLKCPARKRRCVKCDTMGHFQDFCKTKKMKRPISTYDRFSNKNPYYRTNKKANTYY